MEEFEKLVAESFQSDLLPADAAQEKTADLVAPSELANDQQQARPVEEEKTA